jgi:Major capsid protein 13-like
MATGLASNFVIYQDFIKSRISELLSQNGNAFGAASNNAIRLSTQSRPGDYSQTSFFKNISGVISRRVNTSVSTVTDLAMTMDEFITVKLSRKIGPVAQTHDAWKKLLGSYSPALMASIIAEQAANAIQIDMLDSAIRGTAAALKGQTGSYLAESSLGSMTSNGLISLLAKMGDRADRIVCWVMHSKPFYDLVKGQFAANVTGVSNFNIATATPVTLGRPVVVTDSAALLWGSSPDVQQYYTLGLVDSGVQVENTEEQEVVMQEITGLDTLVLRYQGEFAYNLGVKGFKWDTANGGVNPVNSAINDGTNWDPALTDVRERAGVVMTTL